MQSSQVCGFPNSSLFAELVSPRRVVNSPLKNEKSRQILLKSRNLAQPTNGSRNIRFCVYRSHICFSIKSLHFFISDSDFKMPISASLGFTIRHPYLGGSGGMPPAPSPGKCLSFALLESPDMH